MAIFFPADIDYQRIGRKFKRGFRDRSHMNGGGSVGFELVIPPNGDDVRGMFVWVTSNANQDPLDTAEDRSELLNFCINKNINRLYVDTFEYLGPSTTNDTKKANMRSFISNCSDYGISVYGLGGNTDWSSGSVHGWITNNIINPLVDFNVSGSSAERFQGYCLDAEYWTTDQPPAEAVESLDDLITIFDNSDVNIHLFTAFYLMDNSGSRAEFEYNGKQAQDGEHLMDIMSRVSGSVIVGSYYDSGGVQASYTEAWTDYSTLSASIDIYSGAETIDVGNDNTTYFEEGEAVMNAQLQDLSSYFSNVSLWKGTIIHSYDGYSNLGV